MTHGGEKGYYGTDSQYIMYNDMQDLEDITHYLFNSNKCRSLDRKPKIFFMAACRCSNTVPGHQPSYGQIESNNIDFFYGYAASNNSVLYETYDGDLFITKLCDEMQNYWKFATLKYIFKRVIREVTQMSVQQDPEIIAQTPEYNSTLSKEIYFGNLTRQSQGNFWIKFQVTNNIKNCLQST